MMQRCFNKKSPDYNYYGGRGIKVCQEWTSSKIFLMYCDKTYIRGRSLDRINNDGNYEPSNCRWATREEQSNNTRFTELRRKTCINNLSNANAQRKKQRINFYGDPLTRKDKRCHKCKIWRQLVYFSKNKNMLDGLVYTCKKCMADYYRERIKCKKK